MSLLLWFWVQYPIVMVCLVIALLVTVVGFFKSFGPRDPCQVEMRSCVHVVEADTEPLRTSKLLRREVGRGR